MFKLYRDKMHLSLSYRIIKWQKSEGYEMKKSIWMAALFALLVGASATASDKGVYVGLDIGNTSYDYKIEADSGEKVTGDDDGGSQTIKLGYYPDKNNRVALFYQHINMPADVDEMTLAGMSFDYLIGKYDFKPFIGGVLGYAHYKDSVVNLEGGVFGAELGVNYSISKHFSAELGYRYMKSTMEDKVTVSGTVLTVTIDPIKNWFLGVNYKF